MDNKSALPNPIDSSQAADAQPIASSAIGATSQQYGVQAQGTADALARASSAVEAVLAQTSQNPSARLRAIADIKATYIKEQFGVDIAR